ncbi:ABC transporter ATP-binding protein [Sulfitobacter aestuarii]|uniref:ABC transporter ATP-binding protein n=1 Tax=Sulfitobacter aestuarii TaxID=2161676 RepID=A0ABW5U018_9RHOB
MILSCENLGWQARRKQIVQGIDLTLRPGETLGLIGPNGSGKSTLLRMLAGIRAPSAGAVLLNGQPMAKLRRREIAQNLALVEQHAEARERISVREAVELGRTPWLSALRRWSTADEAAVRRALTDADLIGFEAEPLHTLSGGERQRVHIARALAQRPQVLLLDEPTNHLDIRHQLSILHLVRALPVTSVIALHDLNQALLCDRICVLQQGRMVACGAPGAVLSDALLREVFGVCGHFLTDPSDRHRVIRFHTEFI